MFSSSSCINDLILSFDSKAPTSELLASHTFSRFFHRCSVNCDWTRVKFIQPQLIVLKSSHMATPVIPSNYQTCCFLQSIIFCFKPLLPRQLIPCTQLVSYFHTSIWQSLLFVNGNLHSYSFPIIFLVILWIIRLLNPQNWR